MDFSSFFDELEKISVAHGRMTVSKSREGRRPMSVDTLLKKDKEGELYKETGNDSKIAQFYGTSVPFSIGVGSPMGPEAPGRRKKGDIPSREDLDQLPKREDGRANATTVPGQSVVLSDIGVSNTDKA